MTKNDMKSTRQQRKLQEQFVVDYYKGLYKDNQEFRLLKKSNNEEMTRLKKKYKSSKKKKKQNKNKKSKKINKVKHKIKKN